MKEFTFRLKADVSYLEEQFKNGAKALKDLALQADKAEDKLAVLQETGNYVRQLDIALAKVKKKYPNLFQEIFGNVSSQINESLSPLGKMSDEMIKIFGKTRLKLDELIKKPTAATVSEIEEVGDLFKLLAKTMGNTSIDFSFLDGSSKNETKIKRLISAAQELEQSYFNVGKAANTIDIEAKPKKRRSSKKSTPVESGGENSSVDGFTEEDGDVNAPQRAKKVTDANKKVAMSYDELVKSVERYLEIQEKIDEISSKRNRTDDDQLTINKLEEESDNIISNLDKIKEGAFDVLENLQSGDIDKAGAIKQLSDLLGISQTQGIDSAIDKVEILSQKINEVFKNAKKQKVELSVVITPDDINVRPGDKTGTKISESLGNMLSSVGSEYFIDSHTHRDRSSQYNAVDFQDLVDLKKYGVTSTKAIFGNDGVNTIDLSGVSDVDAQKLSDVLKSLNKVSFSAKEINDALADINPKYGEIAKSWNPESFNDLANYFIQIANNADKSITPVERFKNIIQWFSEGKFDFSKYTKELLDFKPENAGDIFNKMVPTLIGGESVEIDASRKSLADALGDIAASSDPVQETTRSIQGQIETYDELCSVVERYNQLTSKDRRGEASKDEKSELDNIFDRINDINQDADLVDLFDEDILDAEKLANALGMEIPQGAHATSSALNGVESAADGAGSAISDMGDELDEALAQETGSLEQKLERLRDVADEYGKNITQRDRNSLNSLIDKENEGELTGRQEERLSELQEEIDEADEALMNFEEQYDKIILKLANGKKVEILPNDKGLRDLYKFMDEGFGEEFNGVKIDDIEFIRKAAAAIEESTNNSNELCGALEGASGATRDLKAEADAAKKAFDLLSAEVNESWYNMSDIDIGRNTQGLDSAIDQLRLLADQGAITSEEMIKFEMAYREAIDQLNMRKTSNEYDRDRAKHALEYGGYEDGYQDGYNNARNDYHEELYEYKNTIAELQQELAEALKTTAVGGGQISDSFVEESSVVKTNIQAEIDQLERLENKIFEVKHAVEQKIQAFVNEGRAVDSNVSKEIAALDTLIAKINEVKVAVNAKSDAFKQEGNVVDGAVKKETKKKSSSSKKKVDDTPEVSDKDASAEAEKQAAAEAKVNEELQKQAELNRELAKQKGTLNHHETQAKDAQKVLGDTWNDGQAEEYEQMIALIGEYKKSKKLLSEEELQGIRKVVSGYQEQAKAINEAKAAEEKRAKDTKAAEEKAKNAYGAKELGKATNTMEKAYDYGAIYKDSTKVQAQLETVRKTYAQLEAAQKELANSTGVVTEEQKQAFRILVADFNKEYGTLNKIIKDSENLIAKSRFTPVDIDPSVAADMNKLEAVMKQAVEAGEEGKVRFGQFNATLQTMEYQIKDTNGQWVTFLARLDSTGTKVVAANSAIKKTNTLLKDITSSTLSKMKSAIGNITGYDLIYRLINVTKQGIQYVREIDSALTELKKVTDETEESYANFLQTASKTAAAVGSTVKDITTMTADWSRLGYSMEQAASLAESTAVLLNVSEFSDANQASEALISTIQAYGYAADESMSVVDVLNEVGKFIARR